MNTADGDLVLAASGCKVRRPDGCCMESEGANASGTWREAGGELAVSRDDGTRPVAMARLSEWNAGVEWRKSLLGI